MFKVYRWTKATSRKPRCLLSGSHSLYLRSVPSPRGGFGGLSLPKQSSKPSNWNTKHYKFVECLSNLNVKPPRTNLKPPYSRLSGDGSACSWNLQTELKVTHENSPTALPRFKNVILRHHYVMQKNSSCIETEKSYLCKVLHFNRQSSMLISPNDWATAWQLLKIPHWTLKNSMRCVKKRCFV